MSFETRDYLRHILVEADYLIARSHALSYEAFSADETLRRAFVRSIEIIGEAAKKGPDRVYSRARRGGSRIGRISEHNARSRTSVAAVPDFLPRFSL